MLDTLRKPFFIVALILIALTAIVEAGSGAKLSSASMTLAGASTPGKGILSLALLDALLLFTVILIGFSIVIPERVQGRIQGIVTLIFSLLLLFGAVAMLIETFVLLTLMLSLLLAPIFGTVAYLVAFGTFQTGPARVTLGLLMTLKLAFAACLVLAHQRFLQNKGLVLLVLLSLVCTFLVSFLQGFVPGFLVSITDDIGAIVVCVVVLIFGILLLIGSIFSVIKAII